MKSSVDRPLLAEFSEAEVPTEEPPVSPKKRKATSHREEDRKRHKESSPSPSKYKKGSSRDSEDRRPRERSSAHDKKRDSRNGRTFGLLV